MSADVLETYVPKAFTPLAIDIKDKVKQLKEVLKF
jgi:hypothetical protein